MRGRIADAIVLAVAAAIALFALSVAVSNSHPAKQYPSTLGDSPWLAAGFCHAPQMYIGGPVSGAGLVAVMAIIWLAVLWFSLTTEPILPSRP